MVDRPALIQPLTVNITIYPLCFNALTPHQNPSPSWALSFVANPPYPFMPTLVVEISVLQALDLVVTSETDLAPYKSRHLYV